MAPWCWPHKAIAGFFSSFDQRLVALPPCRGRGLVHGRIGGRMHRNLRVTALNCPWGFAVVPGVAIVSAATDADSAVQNQPNEWPASLQRRHRGSAWRLDDPTDIQWNCEQSLVKRGSGAAHIAIESVPHSRARVANHARTMCIRLLSCLLTAAAMRFQVGRPQAVKCPGMLLVLSCSDVYGVCTTKCPPTFMASLERGP